MKIHELNVLRIRAHEHLENLGRMNSPADADERLKSRAQYALALDAWHRAEADYAAELSKMTSADLMAIAGIPDTPRTQSEPVTTEINIRIRDL